jgi:hypothetical protein
MHAVGEFGVAGVLAFWAETGCEAATIRRADSPIAIFCMVGGSNVRLVESSEHLSLPWTRLFQAEQFSRIFPSDLGPQEFLHEALTGKHASSSVRQREQLVGLTLGKWGYYR